jgi:hypothetical protein
MSIRSSSERGKKKEKEEGSERANPSSLKAVKYSLRSSRMEEAERESESNLSFSLKEHTHIHTHSRQTVAVVCVRTGWDKRQQRKEGEKMEEERVNIIPTQI